MNAEIRTEWVQALRSGEYEQGQNNLRTADGQFCCLGVLCEIAVKHGVLSEPVLHDGAEVFYYLDESVQDNYDSWLPPKVKQWAGIETDEGSLAEQFPSKIVSDEVHNLSGLNDNGYTFAEIADVIETVEIE